MSLTILSYSGFLHFILLDKFCKTSPKWSLVITVIFKVGNFYDRTPAANINKVSDVSFKVKWCVR